MVTLEDPIVTVLIDEFDSKSNALSIGSLIKDQNRRARELSKVSIEIVTSLPQSEHRSFLQVERTVQSFRLAAAKLYRMSRSTESNGQVRRSAENIARRARDMQRSL